MHMVIARQVVRKMVRQAQKEQHPPARESIGSKDGMCDKENSYYP